MEKGELYKKTDDLRNLAVFGYDVTFVSLSNNWSPHYHLAMEIIYILQGTVDVFLDRQKYILKPGDFVVVDSMMMHEVICKNRLYAGIIVEISKKYMKKFLPDLELLFFRCSNRSASEPGKEEAILKLQQILRNLALLYKEQNRSYMLRSNGLIMELLAVLVENFSRRVYEVLPPDFIAQMERLGSIIDFVEEQYQRPVSLKEAADHVGLNREYFCRYFKKNTGSSFLEYLNNVRLNHVYKDLLLSTDPVGVVVDRNGITNQKLFYMKFKEKFGCTPTQVRKTGDIKK